MIWLSVNRDFFMIEIFLRKSLLLTTLVFRGDYRGRCGSAWHGLRGSLMGFDRRVRQGESADPVIWPPQTLNAMGGRAWRHAFSGLVEQGPSGLILIWENSPQPAEVVTPT